MKVVLITSMLLILVYQVTCTYPDDFEVRFRPKPKASNVSSAISGKIWQARLAQIPPELRKHQITSRSGRNLCDCMNGLMNLVFGYLPNFLSIVLGIIQWKIQMFIALLQMTSAWIDTILGQISGSIITVVGGITGAIGGSISEGAVPDCHQDTINDLEANMTMYEEQVGDEDIEDMEPHLACLVVALPPPEEDKEEQNHELVVDVLGRQENYAKLKKHLKVSKKTTIGKLLKKYIDVQIKKQVGISKEEAKALKYYKNKVDKGPIGKLRIEWVVPEHKTVRINIAKTMDLALRFQALSSANKKHFNIIIDFLKENLDVLEEWEDWSKYPTAGVFTRALFRHILKNPKATDDVESAIKALLPLIHLNGNGAQPVVIVESRRFKKF